MPTWPIFPIPSTRRASCASAQSRASISLSSVPARRPRCYSWMGCRTPATWGHSSGLPSFGVDAVIVLDGSVDPWNPKAVRAAAGASFHTPIARASWAEARPWLEEQHIEILAADTAGDDVRSFQVRGSWLWP